MSRECRTLEDNLPPLPRAEVLAILRQYIDRALRPFQIEPMRDPAAPDVSEDFTLGASWGCRKDVLMEAECTLDRFIRRVQVEFKDRIASARVKAVYVPDEDWPDRDGALNGEYYVTLTASLTTL